MKLVSRRKIRQCSLFVGLVIGVVLTLGAIYEVQLNKEIEHFKTYFRVKRDSIKGIYNPFEIKQIPEETIDELYNLQIKKYGDSIDWDKYAYYNYVANIDYLCNTLVMFDQLLNKYHTKAKLALLVSRDLVESDSEDTRDQARVLLDRIMKLDEKRVIVKLVNSIKKPNDQTQWSDSLTKLLVFNETEFERIIFLDNDAILTGNMDELFFLPSHIKFAAPITYWFLSESDVSRASTQLSKDQKSSTNLNVYLRKLKARVWDGKMIYNHLPNLPSSLYLDHKNAAKEILLSSSYIARLLNLGRKSHTGRVIFASDVMVIKPSTETFNRIMLDILPRTVNKGKAYDMDIINDELYNLKKIIYKQFTIFKKLKKNFVPEVMVLPFGRYGLLTGSIRNKNHHGMIANDILGYKRHSIEGEEVHFDLSNLMNTTKYMHLSDYPLAKPWVYTTLDMIECHPDEISNASDKESCILWNSVYRGFMESRDICKETVERTVETAVST